MTTDERRAIAFLAHINGVSIENSASHWKTMGEGAQKEWLAEMRAIRESDEAAGMVLVPRDAWKHAIFCLTEAEAILGGEYGDFHMMLCERMIELKDLIAAYEAGNE